MALATKRPRETWHPNSPPKRQRTSATTYITASQPLPRLPPELWHKIASQLPLRPLTALSETSRSNNTLTRRVLHSALRDALLPDLRTHAPAQLEALLSIVRLLDAAPSLRPKRCLRQLARLLDASAAPAEPRDAISCFTAEQAATFLRVDPCVLRARFPAARVAAPARARSRKLRSLYSFAFQAAAPRGRRASAVFCLRTVLRAALAAHADLRVARRYVAMAVREDRARFERAQRAEEAVERAVGAGAGVGKQEVEWVLAASEVVVDFRRGVWGRGFDECVGLVERLVGVHVGLGACYKFLLICDGNARLKARRIVEKVLRGEEGIEGEGGVREMVKVLEGKLWWARSKSNVEKMTVMFNELADIRV